jgi:hypothetical protein
MPLWKDVKQNDKTTSENKAWSKVGVSAPAHSTSQYKVLHPSGYPEGEMVAYFPRLLLPSSLAGQRQLQLQKVLTA